MAPRPRGSENASPGRRARTEFKTTRFFDDALASLQSRDPRLPTRLLADVESFEVAWRGSQPGDRLPERFNFKEIAKLAGQYRVCQIYVVQGKYRAELLFIHDGSTAYLLDVFKKTKKENSNEIKLALDHAAAVWEELQRALKTR